MKVLTFWRTHARSHIFVCLVKHLLLLLLLLLQGTAPQQA
jgi:hypothetical protein